jgi:multimeric flavodoxin WrbA
MISSNGNRLLILNGSPIRGSNTDIISEEIARGASDSGWQHQTVYLNDYVITPCQACGARDDDEVCILHDDIYPLFDAFSDCDAVILASPIYFDSLSAQAKLFVDRCNCYRPLRQSPDGELYLEEKEWKKRKGIAVLVGGERKQLDHALRIVKGFFIWTGVEFHNSILYTHDTYTAGAVADEPKILRQAYNLGNSL